MEKWLMWAMEIQAIAQSGLAYTDNVYDTERYERLRQLSAEIIAEKSNIPLGKVKDLFCNETGYQTPKLDMRAAVFKEGKNSAGSRKERHVVVAGRMVRRFAIGKD